MPFSTGCRLIRKLAIMTALTGGLWVSAGGTMDAKAETISLFAAASLGDVMADISKEFQQDTGHTVSVAAAGSSVLARQIQAGAPAQVFISANPDWMAELDRQGLIYSETLQELLGNQLVLITGPSGPAAPAQPLVLNTDLDLSDLLGGGRLAMALVQAVPAGIYGKAALQSLGLWRGISDQVAQTDNVRAALALVALGAVPLGIVYETDARAEPRVQILGRFPADSHPPIRYPIAAIRQGTEPTPGPGVLAFLAFVQTPSAQQIFADHGFEQPEDVHAGGTQ